MIIYVTLYYNNEALADDIPMTLKDFKKLYISSLPFGFSFFPSETLVEAIEDIHDKYDLALLVDELYATDFFDEEEMVEEIEEIKSFFKEYIN